MAKHDQRAPWPEGPMGLGLCYSCVSDYWQDQHQRDSAEGSQAQGPRPGPRHAITMAPSQKPILGPDGTVAAMMLIALPTCYRHLVFSYRGNPQPPGQQQRPAPVPAGRRWNRGDLLP